MSELPSTEPKPEKQKNPEFGEMMDLHYDLVDGEWDDAKADRLKELLTIPNLREYYLNVFLVEMIFDSEVDYQQARIPKIIKIVGHAFGDEQKNRIEELFDRYTVNKSWKTA